MEPRQFEIIGGHGAIVWDYTITPTPITEAPGGTTVTTETERELRAEIARLTEENERLRVLIKTMRH
jgi:hypothetical protein